MSELKIAGNPLPGMPWEERPEGCKNVMWRCSANPIIPRDLLPTSNRQTLAPAHACSA